MKTLLSTQIVCFRQAIGTKSFLFSVIGVALMLAITAYGMIGPRSDILSVAFISGSGNLWLIVATFPLLPFAMSFAADWSERATHFWVVRTGVGAYVAGKVVMSAISAFLVTFLGMLLHVSILSFRLPLYAHFQSADPYTALLSAQGPVMYLVATASHLSLSSSIFAVVALWVSSYISHPWTVLATPVALYFFMIRLTDQWQLPPYLKMVTLIESSYHAGSPASTWLLKLGITLMLTLLLGYATFRQIRRRIQHG